MKRPKKALGDAIAGLILFSVFITVSAGIIISFQNFTIQSQQDLQNSQQFLQKQLQSELEYTNITYNSINSTFEITLKNTGTTTLTTSKFTHFINDNFYHNISLLTNSSNQSIEMFISPNEEVYFKLPYVLNSNQSVTIKSVNEYGVSILQKYSN